MPIVCIHPDALKTSLVCAYLTNTSPDIDYYRWFIGSNQDSILVCTACFVRLMQGDITIALAPLYLSCSPQESFSVWNRATGERLLHLPDICPSHYHPGAKQFLRLEPSDRSAFTGRLMP